jgi:hypothetical protein
VTCAPTTSSSYSAARRGSTTIDRLAPPIRTRGQTGDGDLVPFHWAPIRVNPTLSSRRPGIPPYLGILTSTFSYTLFDQIFLDCNYNYFSIQIRLSIWIEGGLSRQTSRWMILTEGWLRMTLLLMFPFLILHGCVSFLL